MHGLFSCCVRLNEPQECVDFSPTTTTILDKFQFIFRAFWTIHLSKSANKENDFGLYPQNIRWQISSASSTYYEMLYIKDGNCLIYGHMKCLHVVHSLRPCIRRMRPRYERRPKQYCPDVIEFHCGLNEGILLFWSIAL